MTFTPVDFIAFQERERHTAMLFEQRPTAISPSRRRLLSKQYKQRYQRLCEVDEEFTPSLPLSNFNTNDDDTKIKLNEATEESVAGKFIEAISEPSTHTEDKVVNLTDNRTSKPEASDYYLRLTENFTVGMWFKKQEQPEMSYRCKLAAIIRSAGKYIIINSAGIKVAEETQASLALQLESGELKIESGVFGAFQDSPLFDTALNPGVTTSHPGTSRDNVSPMLTPLR